MPDFIKNNRFGLGAGLMVTLLAAAFGEGLGLIPMLLGGLAFALVGGVLGKDENGIMSGLFKKSPETTTPTPSNEASKEKPIDTEKAKPEREHLDFAREQFRSTDQPLADANLKDRLPKPQGTSNTPPSVG